MNNYRKPFFSGRNGADELSVTLVVAGVVLFLAYPIFDSTLVQGIFIILSGASVAIGILRSLSRNIGKRRQENASFLEAFKSESDSERKARKERRKEEKRLEEERRAKRREEEKTHAFFRCPQCGKELRVPKGKGKIRIKCPNCSHSFIRKS